MWGKTLGLLSLLSEDDTELQSYALKQLELSVLTSWPQIADKLDVIKNLAKKKDFFDYKHAALLASKVSYYLGDLDSSFEYALLSKELFDIKNTDDYTSKVISHSIRCYITNLKNEKPISSDHSQLVNNIIQTLFQSKKYMDVLCLSIETHLTDQIRELLEIEPSLTSDAISLTMKTVEDFKYKQILLNLLINFSVMHKDKFQLSQLYTALQDSKSVAELLIALSSSDNEDQQLLSFQIAFELAENAHQQFRTNIISYLQPNMDSIIQILKRTTVLKLYLEFLFKRNHSNIQVLILLKDTFDSMRPIVQTSIVLSYALMYAGTADDNFYRNNTHWFTNAQKWSQFITAAAVGVIHIGHLQDAMKILDSFLQPEAPEFVLGGALYALGLIFANYSWNESVIIKIMDTFRNPRIIMQVPVMHGACLSLGLISMGSRNEQHYEQLRKILYLDIPEPGEAAGYAMGMVMLGSGYTNKNVVDEMVEFANKTEHEKIMRGISMGLAFVMYGTEEASDQLVDMLLKNNQALMRESAMWITALAYVGTASNAALKKLLHSAVSDTNDNVRRAAVIGVGFVLSRSPSDVPSMVDLLSKSYNPHIRAGSAFALGIACAGTGMKEAINIIAPLLEDSEDIVKQAAIISMGMVMMQQSENLVPYVATFRDYLRKMIDRKIRRNDMLIFGICTACGILNAGGRNVVISCNSLRGENSVAATVGLALFCNHFFWHPLALMLSLSFHPTAVIGLDKNLDVVDWLIKSNCPPSTFGYQPTIDCDEVICDNIIPEPLQLSISSMMSHPRFSNFKSSSVDKMSSMSISENDTDGRSRQSHINSSDNNFSAEEFSNDEDLNNDALMALRDHLFSNVHNGYSIEEEEEEEKCEEEYIFEEEEEEPQFERLPNMSRVTLRQLNFIENDDFSQYKPVTGRLTLGFVMLKKA